MGGFSQNRIEHFLTLKTGGSNEGKMLTFAISGCSELITIPFRTRAGRVSSYELNTGSYPINTEMT